MNEIIGKITPEQTIKGRISVAGISKVVSNVDDVQINGTSIVVDKVANIPIATSTVQGVIRAGNTAYGIVANSQGDLYIMPAKNQNIDNRTPKDDYSSDANNRCPIVPSHLDYAVKQAMCDGKGDEWTDEEKSSARERLGVNIDVNKEYVDNQNDLQNIKISELSDNVDTKISDQYPVNSSGYFLENRIFIGDGDNNINNAFTSVRRMPEGSSVVTGTLLNGASFGVNSDGSASFLHKTYDLSSTKGNLKSGRNNAVLRFYATRNGTSSEGKIQFAINNTSSSTPPESAYKDVAMFDDIKQVMCYDKGDKWTEAEKAKAQEKLGIVVITQEEYDLLEVKGEKTIYIII